MMKHHVISAVVVEEGGLPTGLTKLTHGSPPTVPGTIDDGQEQLMMICP